MKEEARMIGGLNYHWRNQHLFITTKRGMLEKKKEKSRDISYEVFEEL